MAGMLPTPDITFTVEENSTEPFKYKEKEFRDLFANHQHKEDILEGDHILNIQDYDKLKMLGPHPLMERQTYQDEPKRWIHAKLEVAARRCWLMLIMRADNMYVKGFANERGKTVFCYEICEPVKHGEPQGGRVKLLPGKYQAIPLAWDVTYSDLVGPGRNPEDELKMMAADPNFVANTIQFLSSHDPIRNNNEEAKWRFAGLIFKLCEFTRMKLTLSTDKLFNKVQRWGDVCLQLTKWKRREYKDWDEKQPVLRNLHLKLPRDALELVYLVLNRAEVYFANLEANKPKKSSKKGGKKDGKDGCSDSGNKSAPSKDSKKDDQSGGGEEPPMEDGNPVPCGRQRVQLLCVRANFAIEAINFYDWHRGQAIYRRRYDAQDPMGRMLDLVLIGPRRAIGAYGPLGIEVFPAATTGSEELWGSEGELAAIFKGWDPCNNDEEATSHVKVFDGPFGRVLEISYLLIPNTIEAKVEVCLLLGRLGCHGFHVVSGMIKARAIDYEGKEVCLFNEKWVVVGSQEWTSIPLQPSLVCLPYRPDLQLDIDVDLTVIGPFDRQQTNIKNLKFNDLMKFNGRVGQEERKFDGNQIKVNVSMNPDPTVEAYCLNMR